MNKSVWALVLAAGLLGACGGVTSEDIEAAARQNNREDAASGLSLAIGQFWVTLQTSKTTNENGTVSTTGQFTGVAATTNISESQETVVDKVMGTTYVEPADKNGFVIEQVRRQTASKTTSGSTTTVGNLSGVDDRGGYVMFELDNWIRVMFQAGSGDLDQNPGSAVNPIAPRLNAFYTTDQGYIWKGEQVEEVMGVKSVKMSRVFAAPPYKVEDFYKNCFTESNGTVPGTRNVDVKSQCLGTWIDSGGTATFVLEQNANRWVGRKVSLKRVEKSVVIQLNRLVCQDGTANPPLRTFNQGLVDCNGTVVFQSAGGGEKVTSEDTEEVTKFGQAKDKKALPNIDTDAQ